MFHNKLQTPYYLFNEGECTSRVIRIKDEVKAWGGKICYAIKANPFLIPSLLSFVDKFEVCSPGELEICRRYNVPGEKILFSGVVKTREDIKNALDYPVDTVTLESMTHWSYLKECLSDSVNKGVIKILPRLSSGAQFGMSFELICQIVTEQKTMENIHFEGIHFFTGTQKKNKAIEKELLSVKDRMLELKELLNGESLYLEYGPGLAVPYFENDNFDNPYGAVCDLKDFIISNNFEYRIDIELGRYIAASCGTYHTSVVDLKSAEDRFYCLVDGGINHVNYYGQNMAMRTPIIEHITSDKNQFSNDELAAYPEKHTYMICGSLCTFADILVRGIEFDDMHIGDELVFKNIGAYSVTESSYLFLSHELPGIYLKKSDGTIIQIRSNEETYTINSYEKN